MGLAKPALNAAVQGDPVNCFFAAQKALYWYIYCRHRSATKNRYKKSVYRIPPEQPLNSNDSVNNCFQLTRMISQRILSLSCSGSRIELASRPAFVTPHQTTVRQREIGNNIVGGRDVFNHIFVSFLESKGFLTTQQALDALEAQKDAKIRIGTLAVEEKMMTPEQAETINRQQASQNARFGDLAVKGGYLTQEQLDYLIDLQPHDHTILKQILHDKKYIDAGAVDTALVAFKDELGFNDTDFGRLLNNHVDTYISKIASIDGKEQPILTVFARLFITTAIRLVDKEIMVGKAEKVSNGSIPYTILLKLKGDATNALVFSAGEVTGAIEFAGKFAEGFMGTSIDATDEIARDAMKEFLNCVGGLFTTELTSKTHLNLDLEVPKFLDAFPVESEVVTLPFSLLEGGFRIFIS